MAALKISELPLGDPAQSTDQFPVNRSGANFKVSLSDAFDFIDHANSTGVISGGVLSIGAPNTTGTIADGTGVIVDHSTPNAPTRTLVTWTGKTNFAITNIATSILTFAAIDISSNVIQQTTPFTNSQTRDLIVLGAFVHVDKTIVNTVNNEQHLSYDVGSQLSDLSRAIGFFNVSGNVYSPDGVNLNIDKSVGNIHFPGSNYDVDPMNPNVKTLAALNAATFQYRFQDGTNGVTGTAIDPDIWDVGGTSTPEANNKFTVQRIYSFISNAVKIQPGQTEYSTLAAARAGIEVDTFITEPSIAANGLLRGFLIVKEGETDLTSSDTAFIEAEKFGSSSGSSSGSVAVPVLGTISYSLDTFNNATKAPYASRSVGSTGSGFISFSLPEDFSSISTFDISAIPNGTFVGADIDITINSNLDGLDFSTNSVTDTTTTYSFTVDQIGSFDFAALFNTLPAAGKLPGCRVGVEIDQNGIGTTMHYIIGLIEYTRT